jgi:hypothetical protein
MTISPLRALNDVNPANAYGWYEFRTQIDINGSRKVENLARHPLAPRYATLGDGATSTTFPSQLIGRHGLVFDGGDYVDLGLTDVFERTNAFTLFVCCQINPANTYALISCEDVAQAYRGIGMTVTSNLIALSITNGAGNQAQVIAPAVGNSLSTFCATYDGSSSTSGMRLYRDGRALTVTSTANTLTQTVKSGKPFLVGARHNGAARNIQAVCSMPMAAVIPSEYTPQQVLDLHRRAMTRINAA